MLVGPKESSPFFQRNGLLLFKAAVSALRPQPPLKLITSTA